MKNIDNLIYQYTTTSKEELLDLLVNKPKAFYFGIDPTAPNIHLGHLIGLHTCIELIKMGWQCIILIGGFTGIIGDPDKNTERIMQNEENVNENTQGILHDIKRVLSPYNIIYVNNKDWLENMKLNEYMFIAQHISINKKIKLDNFAKRLNNQLSLSGMEFIYPDLQGIDFLHLRDQYNCCLQIGGADQWGNISHGVSLAHKINPNNTYTFGFSIPLLTNRGNKMGKTTNNAINIYKNTLELIHFLSELPEDTQTQLKVLFGDNHYIHKILSIIYHDHTACINYYNEYIEYMKCNNPLNARQHWFHNTSEQKISNIIADIFKVSKERAKIILNDNTIINNNKIVENIRLEHGKYIIEASPFMKTFINIIV